MEESFWKTTMRRLKDKDYKRETAKGSAGMVVTAHPGSQLQ